MQMVNVVKTSCRKETTQKRLLYCSGPGLPGKNAVQKTIQLPVGDNFKKPSLLKVFHNQNGFK
jgi:hypothetical protein